MTVHLVVGAGEVGTAVAAVLARAHRTDIRDVEPVDVAADVLHVCFPWSPSFVDEVRRYEREHGAALTVIHSTVPPGVCDPHRWVHSPVRGRHPHLVEGLVAFVKHFGGSRATEAAAFWQACGLPVEVHPRAIETESAKVWELVGYGVQIALEKAIHAWCRDQGVDFGVVYGRFAATYNEGYVALGYPQFVRPILQHVDGGIGGHCLLPVAHMLDHPLADLVIESSRLAEKEMDRPQ